MTWTRLVTTIALAVAATFGSAAARPGDERAIEGTLVWPEAVGGETAPADAGRIIVHDDLGARYVAQLTTATEIPTPLQAGQRVVVRGREAFDPTHLVATRVASPAEDAAEEAPGGAQVEGTVIAIADKTIVLQTRAERQVAVDISAIALPVRDLLHPGREVRVFGTLREGAPLIAAGLELDYTPAARPGAPAR